MSSFGRLRMYPQHRLRASIIGPTEEPSVLSGEHRIPSILLGPSVVFVLLVSCLFQSCRPTPLSPHTSRLGTSGRVEARTQTRHTGNESAV